jgi:glycosyltransferase involved in cell wall biosynthesis
VLANRASNVLADHIKDSGAGHVYYDYESFAHALEDLSNEETARKMGELGRAYVLSKYQTETIRESLIAAIESS